MDDNEGAKDVDLEDLTDEAHAAPAPPADDKDTERQAADLEAVYDVPVQISAILGHTEIEVSELLKLDEGAVIELDRKVGEAIDIFVNNRLIARGEVVQVENKLGITMTEIIKNDNN
ncbi:Flagellar motor switch protein FliN [hydrothermal vent metagenome]|uniref:Flagellar motor switch protein FliN n=1 Tax=hydrothermal vent metagenome TaxID=652676 RepID=A0A3B0TI36_9ZZZZ